MRRLTAVLAMMLVLGLTQTNVESQKKKPTTTVVPVTATFDASVILDEGFPPVSAGILNDLLQPPYTGTVTLGGSFSLDSQSGEVDFAEEIFDDLNSNSLRPTDKGFDLLIGAHNVGKVVPDLDPFAVPDLDPFAGQCGISWTGENGLRYRLQYGDVYDLDNVDYAHITCSEPDAAGTGCDEWVLSTLKTVGTPTGDSTSRRTGPRAKLTVQAGPGARGLVSLGYFNVPFSLRIRRNP